MQKCANCDQLIGRLEQPRQLGQHIVCAACYEKLKSTDKSEAAAQAPVIAVNPAPAATLGYAGPLPRVIVTHRPRWVYAVIGVYLLLLIGIGSLPIIAAFLSSKGDAGGVAVLALFVAIFFAAGGMLIIVPVRTQWQDAISQRAIWWPLIGSCILFAILCIAVGAALTALIYGDKDPDPTFGISLISGLGVLWLGWVVFFWLLSRSLDPLSLSMRLYKSVLAGSIVELVVAVPMHLIVRRRNDCCAAAITGMAICLGALTAIMALGPGIYFLYKRRWDEVYRLKQAARKRAG